VKQADAIGGYLTREAATSFGLTQGVPVTVGMVDTSSAMLLAGTEPGQLLNVCGSTDVLALCTDKPRPHEKLLTARPGRRRPLDVSEHDRGRGVVDLLDEAGVLRGLVDAQIPEAIRNIGLRPRDSRPRKARAGNYENPGYARSNPSPSSPTSRASAPASNSVAPRSRGSRSRPRAEQMSRSRHRVARARQRRPSRLLEVNDVKIRRRVVVSGGSQDRS
jgi:hypothetical protein